MLEKLREKPHHIKQSVSLAITVVIFSIIMFVWVSSNDARAREAEIQAKAVSPLDGVTLMFSGMVSSMKEKLAHPQTFGGAPNNATTTEAENFDLSRVVIIDPSISTTTSSSTSKNIGNTGAN